MKNVQLIQRRQKKKIKEQVGQTEDKYQDNRVKSNHINKLNENKWSWTKFVKLN